MDASFDIYVVGMRVEKFIDEEPNNNAFDMTDAINTRYILFCIAKGHNFGFKQKFTITLANLYGWCGSGYTTASWGYIKINPVTKFGPATHKIKNGQIKLDDPSINEVIKYNYEPDPSFDDISNEVFSYSYNGYDDYYPRGGITINFDLFEKYDRGFERCPVWIFYGDSSTGKSTLAYYMSKNMTIVETDSFENNELPEIIWADIIVVGNKYSNIKVIDILSRLPEGTEPVFVKFSK